VVRRRPIGNTIYFQGGTASKKAVAAALAGLLSRKITVPPYNRVMGAVGAALLAREWSRESCANKAFRGYRLGDLQFSARSFACSSCNNHCDVKEFTIGERKSYWGNKCSDRYSRPAISDRRPVIPDLVAYREELFDRITANGIKEARFKIGLARALTNLDLYPFWHRYLTELGIHVALSPTTDPKIVEDGQEIASAPFCHPVKAALGHVRALAETEVDYILLPSVDCPGMEEDGNAQCCLWTRTLPYMVESSAALESHAHRFLVPSVSFQEGRKSVKSALFTAMRKLGVSRHDSDRAVEAAYSAQNAFRSTLLTAGRSALRRLAETGEPGLLLVGRSYNIYDRTINCDVPRKLRARYGANVIPFDFLVTGHELDKNSLDGLPWEAGWRILTAAKLTVRRTNMHLIYVSNFLCGPDAATRKRARRMADRPLLFLQFDGHGYDAGYMTRCEAYLDSKGMLRYHKAPTENKLRAEKC
jgi:predicted nucleotide-binding protein (sugar kinase/HSP70/actin superfamily)